MSTPIPAGPELTRVKDCDLCRALKKDPRTRDVPVFVVSARPGKDVVERALAAGAEEFIRKPFENHELIGRIRDRLNAA